MGLKNLLTLLKGNKKFFAIGLFGLIVVLAAVAIFTLPHNAKQVVVQQTHQSKPAKPATVAAVEAAATVATTPTPADPTPAAPKPKVIAPKPKTQAPQSATPSQIIQSSPTQATIPTGTGNDSTSTGTGGDSTAPQQPTSTTAELDETIKLKAGGNSQTYTFSSAGGEICRWYSLNEGVSTSDSVLPEKDFPVFLVIESPQPDPMGGVVGSSITFHFHATASAALGTPNGGPDGYGFYLVDESTGDSAYVLLHIEVIQ